MSDGMSDGAALGRLEIALDNATHDFAEALRDALMGHRGWAVGVDLAEINRHLKRSGYELRKVGEPDPSYGRPLPTIGDRYRAFAKRLLDATRPITRWPCTECGRPNETAKLRLIERTLQDGQHIRGGCIVCNDLAPLWKLADAILAGEDIST